MAHTPEGSEGACVRVAIRVRPLPQEEEERSTQRTMRCCNPKTLEFLGTTQQNGNGAGSRGNEYTSSYTFDLCAHEGFSQEEFFSSCGLKLLLKAAVDGYSGIGRLTQS